jgi:hypothetical protein
VHAHVAFGCAAKNGERFDVPIQLSASRACLRATTALFPPDSYPKLTPRASCTPQPVTLINAARGSRYEQTHGQRLASYAMPYVEEDAAALDLDWQRIATILAPPTEPRRAGVSDSSSGAIAVGSLQHTTARWSYVRESPHLRLYQLLAVKDGRGREGYLTLHSRVSPREMRDGSSAWRFGLLSPGYEVEAEVAFTARPPRSPSGGYTAIQTELELREGQPVARVRYLDKAPELAGVGSNGASTASNSSRDFTVPLVLNLEDGCLAEKGSTR